MVVINDMKFRVIQNLFKTSDLPAVECRFLSIMSRPDGPIALIERFTDHPILGPPNGKVSSTSKVRLVDFESGICITQNTVYTWRV